MLKVIYSNLLLPGNFISIDILCIYHLPAVRLEYIHLFSDTEYSFCVCKSPTAILTVYIQYWHVAHYYYDSHTVERLRQCSCPARLIPGSNGRTRLSTSTPPG